MTEQLLTLKQVADILNVHTITLRRWEKAGKITFVYLPVSNRIRIAQSELNRITTQINKKDKKGD